MGRYLPCAADKPVNVKDHLQKKEWMEEEGRYAEFE